MLVTLRKKHLLEKLLPVSDGVICGRYFATGFDLSLDDLVDIRKECARQGRGFFICMDAFISENERMLANEYLSFLEGLDVDGIYFHDLGVLELARSFDLSDKLIYDGKSVLCNSRDAGFLLQQGISSLVISRELTLQEIEKIVRTHQGKIEMQIFGHLRLSYSKRKFLSNYFAQIGKDYDFFNKESLSLVEEKRDYRMPIIEDEYGTCIYTDYLFEMFSEFPGLSPYLKRGIIDTIFMEDANQIAEVCRDYRRVSMVNHEFIKESLIHNYPDLYSSAYLYQKTNITKDE